MLINGSFNWTGSAVFANNENVVISNHNKDITLNVYKNFLPVKNTGI